MKQKRKAKTYWAAYFDEEPLPRFIHYTKKEAICDFKEFFENYAPDIRKVKIIEVRKKK